MSGLFGRGGASASDDVSPDKKYDSPFSTPTEPAPLEVGKNKPNKPSSGGGFGGGFGSGGYYDSRGNGSSGGSRTDGYRRHREDPEHDFSDIAAVDELTDEELKDLRKDNYKLSNEERFQDIKHKSDFNNIVKIILICFSIIVGFGFMIIIGIIAYTSVMAGHVTETGIAGSILNFIVDLIKISMS